MMRDFVGMDRVNAETRKALLEFSFQLTTGNMDEAYKAVKLIKRCLYTSIYTYIYMYKLCIYVCINYVYMYVYIPTRSMDEAYKAVKLIKRCLYTSVYIYMYKLCIYVCIYTHTKHGRGIQGCEAH